MRSFYSFMKERVKRYYETCNFGEDFFTAPELDRAFGYSVAHFLIPYLKRFKSPTLFELGAGRGTFAHDFLSYLKLKDGELFKKVKYLIYEGSEKLREVQRKNLREFEGKVEWVDDFIKIRGVIFSNEFFDCLPVHIVKEGKELFLDEGGKELFLPVKEKKILDYLKRLNLQDYPYELEVCLDCIEFLKKIGESLEEGYNLLIDYGYTKESRPPNRTVQVYKRHKVYKEGEGDMSAFVDFSALIEFSKDFKLKTVFLKGLRDFLLSNEYFLDELKRLSLWKRPEDLERLSRLKVMLISMKNFKVLFQTKLQ